MKKWLKTAFCFMAICVAFLGFAGCDLFKSKKPIDPKSVLYGDVNLDGAVDYKDLTVIREYIASYTGSSGNIAGKPALSKIAKANFDVNKDDELNMQDLMLVRSYLSGARYELAVGSLGDVEIDGDIDSDDAIYITQYLANEPGYTLTAQQKINADINFDGEITKIDADKILFHSLFGDYIPSVTVVPGDIDLDGEVTSADADLLNKYLNNNNLDDEDKVVFNYRQYQNAKITADNSITVADYNALLSQFVLYGDVNLDGVVDYLDADFMSVYLANYDSTGNPIGSTNVLPLSTTAKLNFDVHNDNLLKGSDLTCLLKYLAGKTYELVEGSLGDVDMDGDIDNDDSTILANYIAGNQTLTKQQKINADVDLDGDVTPKDAMIQSRYLSDLPQYDDVTIPSINVVPGDIDLDGEVTSADATLLQSYLNNNDLSDENKVIFNYRQYQNAKITADNEVNEQDLTRLSDYLTGKVYELVPGSLGDVDMDGDIDNDDSTILANYIAGNQTLTKQQQINADVDLDNTVTPKDAMILSRYLSDLPEYDDVTIPSFNIVAGDVDLDGEVTSADATLLQSYLNNNDLSDENKVIFNYRQYQNAKITADDNVTVDDYNALLGLINGGVNVNAIEGENIVGFNVENSEGLVLGEDNDSGYGEFIPAK